MVMVAIGHQAGLAIENTIFYNDKIQAERLGCRRPDDCHPFAPHQEHSSGHPAAAAI